ncbi:N-6 DNA methylase [Sporosarcina sp. Marseille-Q4063]|uniref:N-6 DNA methylase n=1 Tax=Sporosarcina sp. Marseille-Q4063 TaxID=2810514 RepID=UPI001BAF0F59|nr:N-6 DNA methylase [Sporosarcina sp. Marseille-Q4063]QUW23066.1 N-6 DNA methylase [Sporosarcina sp. Marseille-Q4063]
MNNQIWKMADTLRGELPISDYAELFSVGGLLVYLSKDSRYEKIVDIQKMLRAEANAREKLQQTLHNIENEIPYFKGVFDEMSVLKQLESTQITRFFYELSSINMNGNMEVVEWLDEALKRIAAESGRNGGESVTPESINKLAIAILNPTKGSIYDGVAGYGGGLLEAQRNAWKQNSSLKLYGQEIDVRAWAISKIRLFISGDEENQILKGDVLNQPEFVEENALKKFDFVYMDAPFSMTINNYDSLANDQYNRFFYGMPSRSNGDFAFISHALASLNEDGRAIVVTTEGALFRGAAEGRIRKNIILSDMIEAVISLPSGLYDGTSIPVNLLVFNKNKNESRKNKILFIQASDLFTEKGRKKRVLSEEAIQKITDTFQYGKEISEFSTFVHHSELVDGNLNTNRYVLPNEVEVEGFGPVSFNMDAFEDVTTISLKDVATLFRGFNVGSKNKERSDGKFRIVRLSDVQNGKLMMENISRYHIENNAKINFYELQEDDVILSIRGNSLKAAVVPADDEDLLLSQNFMGIRCNNRLNPDFLKVYLESPLGQYLLTNKMSGTAIPTLSRKDIETLEIPLPPIEEQQQMMEQYIAKEVQVEKEIERLKAELMEMKIQTYTQMGIKDVFSL